MTGNPSWQVIPTELSLEQFEQFVLPHLRRGRRGPPPTLPLHKIFNYILRVLYMGCQWKMLPIERNAKGRREIHYTRIYRLMRRWQADGCMDAIFAGSVTRLHDDQLLDLTVIHGDGTTTAAKKGGDNLGYSGHKHLKGDKVVAFCDRDCNIIAPFICAPGNRNESPLLRDALPRLTQMAYAIGMDLQGSTVSLDGVYDCRANRKAFSTAAWCPTFRKIRAGVKPRSGAAGSALIRLSSRSASGPLNASLPGRTSFAVCCCASNASVTCTTRSRRSPIR
jgi:transposase